MDALKSRIPPGGWFAIQAFVKFMSLRFCCRPVISTRTLHLISTNEQNRGKVFLVDDDQDFLASLVFLLSKADLNCVPFHSADDFLDATIEVGPACLILDQSMPSMSGMELFRQLKLRNFKKPTMFLTAAGTVPSAVEAMKLGAAEYFEKPFEPTKVIDCVRHCIESDRQAMIRASAVEEFEKKFQKLTARELEIAMLVRDGIPSKQIASRLGLSIKTIEVHRSHISKKLGAKSAAQLLFLLSQVNPIVATGMFDLR